MASYTKRALKTMRTYKLPAFAAILSITMATVVVGCFFVLFLNAQNLITHWEAGNRMLVYLTDSTEEERDALETSLNSIEGLTIMRFISKDEGLKFLESQLGSQEDLIVSLGGNPLPDAFEVKLEMATSATQNIREIAINLLTLPNVADVEYGQNWIERGNKILQFLRLAGYTFLIIFVVAGVLIIIGTLKLTIYALKHELDTLRLIGAPNKFIARPFYLQSVIETIVGAAIGLGIVYGLFTLAKSRLVTDAFMLPLTFQPVFLSWLNIACFIIVSASIGIIGTFIALRGSLRL